uniref:MADS-box 13 n=1 Tax=Momordica dioica TaxID=654836 RepID=A0A346NTP2_9ROSI|nr:MADS-box 13 [Momordica dioica]
MGRVKLQIKRIENTSNRQVTYSKRKNGLIKKAYELSILCDIDIALIMFSPSDRLSAFSGETRIEEVIARYIQLTPQDREKAKLEQLEALAKTFKKLSHDVDIHDFLSARNQTIGGLSNQDATYQQQLQECHRELRRWTDIDRFESMEHYDLLEKQLRDTIERIQQRKEHYRSNHLLPYEASATQSHSGIQIPMQMGGNTSFQEDHSMGWLPENGHQQTILAGDSSSLPHRQMDGSITVYSSVFFESTKPENINVGNPGQQFEQLEQQGNGCLGLQQLGENYSSPTPFGTTLGMAEDQDKKIKSQMELNNLQQQQQDPSMYDPMAQNNGECFQIPHNGNMFVNDDGSSNWVPYSMFGQQSYNNVKFLPQLSSQR